MFARQPRRYHCRIGARRSASIGHDIALSWESHDRWIGITPLHRCSNARRFAMAFASAASLTASRADSRYYFRMNSRAIRPHRSHQRSWAAPLRRNASRVKTLKHRTITAPRKASMVVTDGESCGRCRHIRPRASPVDRDCCPTLVESPGPLKVGHGTQDVHQDRGSFHHTPEHR